MYRDMAYQTMHIARFLISFLVLFVLLPAIIRSKTDESRADELAANFIRGVFCVILVGYLLVLTKLFEFITIAAIIVIFVLYRISTEARMLDKDVNEDAGLLILKLLDNRINIFKAFVRRSLHFKKNISNAVSYLAKQKGNILFVLLTLLVLSLSAYIRFYDSVTHAAFPLSDSYITLDWFKAVGRRFLFFEPGGGVYPRGLSIYMATIHKLSFMDEIFVLKYTGPFNALMIVVGLIYVVYKLTKSKYASLAVAALYGIAAGLLGSDIQRQAATNSQEFALVFLLPTIYFLYKYLLKKRRRDLVTATAGLTLMGLIHSFVYVFGVIAACLFIFVLIVSGPVKNFRHYGGIIAGGFFSAVVSLVPLSVGLLEGVSLHGSSVEFLTATADIILKKLTPMHYLSFAAFLLLGIYLIVTAKKRRAQTGALLPIWFFVVAVFFIYYLAAYLTKSTLLDARTQEIWSLCSVLAIGTGFGVLFARVEMYTTGRVFSFLLCTASIFATIFFAGLKPLEPYKMEWDSGVEQYLRITDEYYTKSWTMVAESLQYSMVTGEGFLITTGEFTANYSAEKPFNGNWANLAENIFIYQQKNIFKVSENNSIYAIQKPIYEQMEIDGAAMERWLNKYVETGYEYKNYYEDENIRILLIHNKAYKDPEKLN